MLLSFLPIKNEQGKQVMTSVLDYAANVQDTLNLSSARVWMSTYVPMIFANSPNLADRCTNMCVDCKDYLKLEVKDLNLLLVYIGLPDRYGYLALYKTDSIKLLYLSYIGEITLVNSIKALFTELVSAAGCRNICTVAPIDSIITSEEPYRDEWNSFKLSFMLSSFSYVYLNGSILKCKRVGKQGKDLQVVDKFFVTNKIPDLNKALSHTPTCLINGKLLTDNLANKTVNERIMDRLYGRKIPVAHAGIATALSDMQNDADIIVALAKTKEQDAICARLSNDWLKRAVKHKLNKFPAEVTSDGKYEVQQLTTEATIKYQGDTWKGAEKSDLIYTVTEKASRRPVAIISVGLTELNHIKKRRMLIQDAIKNNKHVIEHIVLEFYSYGLDKDLMKSWVSSEIQNELKNADDIWKHVVQQPDGIDVSWIDLLNYEAILTTGFPQQTKLLSNKIFSCRKNLDRDAEYEAYIGDYYNFTAIKTQPPKVGGKSIFKLSSTYKPVEAHSFNLPDITIIVPNIDGIKQTYKGKVKFGVAYMKNVENPDDTFITIVDRAHHTGVGNWGYSTLSLCDYIFPTMPLHENAEYAKEVERGYQIIASNAIYGKKLKDINKVVYNTRNQTNEALMYITKATATGYEVNNTVYSNALSLGFLPDTYEEYCELIKIDDMFDDAVTRNRTEMYVTSTANDDALLDEMDDDDYSDLLEDDSYEEEYDGFDDEEYEEETPATTNDTDQYDDDYFEDEEDDESWQMQRMLWLQNHPNTQSIVRNGQQVYWFDAMHLMMLSDQPGSAENIALMENIWNNMLAKMTGVDALDLVAMMYDQLTDNDTSDEGTDTDAEQSEEEQYDISDDDDELFADL